MEKKEKIYLGIIILLSVALIVSIFIGIYNGRTKDEPSGSTIVTNVQSENNLSEAMTFSVIDAEYFASPLHIEYNGSVCDVNADRGISGRIAFTRKLNETEKVTYSYYMVGSDNYFSYDFYGIVVNDVDGGIYAFEIPGDLNSGSYELKLSIIINDKEIGEESISFDIDGDGNVTNISA